MELTAQSTGLGHNRNAFQVRINFSEDLVIALAGNPNTGKSTVFNSLTGLNQRTGNWPGKTVANAQGKYFHNGRQHVLVDLPGTYSLMANSADEELSRDFICQARPHAIVVVTDATCLERNLNLVLQLIEISDKIVVCVNLLDEAKRKTFEVNLSGSRAFRGAVVEQCREGKGLDELKEAVYEVASGIEKSYPTKVLYCQEVEKAIEYLEPLIRERTGDKILSRWLAIRMLEGEKAALLAVENLEEDDCGDSLYEISELSRELGSAPVSEMAKDEIRDHVATSIVKLAEDIARRTIRYGDEQYNLLDIKTIIY